MTIAVLIDAASRTIEAIDVDPTEPNLAEDLARIIGCQSLALGARVPTGERIYHDVVAIHSSRHFFRHCLVPSPLPGPAVVLGDRDIVVEHIQPLLEFLKRADIFPSRMQPRWLRDAALDFPASAERAPSSIFPIGRPGNQNRALAV